jgi:hypothetical protein
MLSYRWVATAKAPSATLPKENGDEVRRTKTIQVNTYRGYRLETRDDGGAGWIVEIRPPRGSASPEVLRNHVPNGLKTLVTEAQHRVDQRLGSVSERDF